MSPHTPNGMVYGIHSLPNSIPHNSGKEEGLYGVSSNENKSFIKLMSWLGTQDTTHSLPGWP